MTRRELFLATFRDLEAKAKSKEVYDLVRSSHLVRQLFLDGSASLVDQVNREDRLRFEFDVLEAQAPPLQPETWLSLSTGADYPSSPARTGKGRDAFFRMQVGHHHGDVLTVKDVVRYVAHVLGGVHAGSPDNDGERTLARLEAELGLARTVILSFQKSIAEAVVEALHPLYQRLR